MKLIKLNINIEDIDIPEVKEEENVQNIAIGFTDDTYKLIEKLQLDKDTTLADAVKLALKMLRS